MRNFATKKDMDIAVNQFDCPRCLVTKGNQCICNNDSEYRGKVMTEPHWDRTLLALNVEDTDPPIIHTLTYIPPKEDNNVNS